MSTNAEEAKAARLHIINAMCGAHAMKEVRALMADFATAVAGAKDPQVADAAISIFFLDRLIAADATSASGVR